MKVMASSAELIQLQIQLTNQGDRSYFKVIESIFKYINRLLEVQDWSDYMYLYKEKKERGLIDFENAGKGNPLRLARGLAMRLTNLLHLEDK